MSDEDRMTIDERRKYLRMMKKRYFQADRKERGGLLDEMEAVTGMHRKSVTRLMNAAKKARLISGAQHGAVVSCAANSALP